MAEQVTSDPAALLSLSQPASIVHLVATDLAGRRVFMTWLGDARCAHLRPVQCAVVEVVGCRAGITGRVAISVRVDTVVGDCEFATVGVDDIIGFGRLLAADPAKMPDDTVVKVARWWGHMVEFTFLDGARCVGTVVGFELVEGVNVIVVPVNSEASLVEMLVPVDELAGVVVLD